MTAQSKQDVLMVPVANPETVDRLLDTAIDVARERSMTVVPIHVVEVPAQLPLSEGDRLVDEEQRQILDDAADRCAAAGIEADTRMRYARDVATGIVGAVDEHGVDVLLMGWRGRPRRRDIVLGSFLDRVIGEAACDVFVKRIQRPPSDTESILVPIADGPHCTLSVELAATIAAQRDASVRLLHVLQGDAPEEDAIELLERYTDPFDERGIEREVDVVRNDHVGGAITDATAHHGLTILGATREPFLRRKLVGSVAEGVGRSAASQVILTRKYTKSGEN